MSISLPLQLSRAREEGFVTEDGDVMPIVSDSPQDLVNMLLHVVQSASDRKQS